MGLDVFAILLALALTDGDRLPWSACHPVRAALRPAGSRALRPAGAAHLHRDVHGQRCRVRSIVLPTLSAGGGLRQADGSQRRGRDDRRDHRSRSGPSTVDPGRRPGLRRTDVRRRVAFRGRLCRLSVRVGTVSRGRHPEEAHPRGHRSGGVYAHDGRTSGLAANPESDPHPLFRDRHLRRALGRHAWGSDDPRRRPALAGAPPGASGVSRRGVWDGSS